LCKKGTIQDYFWFKSQRLEDPIYTKNDFKDIDLWLITHNHEDHLDKDGLNVMQKNCKIITNKNSVKKLRSNNLHNFTILNWREKMDITINNQKISIEAIPAIHGVNPISALFAGKVNGYFLTISDKKEMINIYITSDTVYKSKVIKAIKKRPVDLLIPNMGAAKQGSWIMTLTLNAKMLYKIANKLHPKNIIPVHYGTFKHYKEPITEVQKYTIPNLKLVEVGQEITLNL
jgi:L-ascorbate metabolism protein UlaG (beta-lactamase superfamily)